MDWHTHLSTRKQTHEEHTSSAPGWPQPQQQHVPPAFLHIPKPPEPQRGTAKHPCAGYGMIWNCEDSSYILSSVTTRTNHGCLEKQLRLKSCPWTCPPEVETRFLPKPWIVQAVTITGNSHTCYQFRWGALAKLHKTFGLCDHTPLSCQMLSDFKTFYLDTDKCTWAHTDFDVEQRFFHHSFVNCH